MVVQAAGISEIFSSLQGEGTHLGERHLFIRFDHCNLHCDYCDEVNQSATDLNVAGVLESVRRLEREHGPHSFISLTGGEPLFYFSFLKLLCPELKREGLKLYLETNGILWKPLEELIEWLDVIAMDMKPASVTKEKNYFGEHKRFLEIARSRETFVKIILSKEIDILEFRDLCHTIRDVDPAIPLILQPISEKDGEGCGDPELIHLLEELQTMASVLLTNVRIIPRLHKILNVK